MASQVRYPVGPDRFGNIIRWRMFYRALGPTIVMVLAPGQQNAFGCLELLAQVCACVVMVEGVRVQGYSGCGGREGIMELLTQYGPRNRDPLRA